MNQDTESAYGVLTEPATLTLKRRLPGPIERVWAYLTDSELRSRWLASGVMEMKANAPFELVWRNNDLTDPPGKAPDWFTGEHRMQGHIVDAEPPHRLVFTWAGSGNVSIELAAQGEAVLLTLTHHRLPDRDTMRGISICWWHAWRAVRPLRRIGTIGRSCAKTTTSGCRLERSRRARQLGVAETVRRMVIHQPHRLHVRVDDGGPHKTEAALFQILADRIRQRGAGRHLAQTRR